MYRLGAEVKYSKGRRRRKNNSLSLNIFYISILFIREVQGSESAKFVSHFPKEIHSSNDNIF